MDDYVVHSITTYPLAIPLRARVKHAATERWVADPVVVAVTLRNGTMGYGETLPREYVTGESVHSVIETTSTLYAGYLATIHATSFAAALEAIEALPWFDAHARHVPAARAAVEMALLDAAMRFYGRAIDDVVQWMGLPGFGSPGSLRQIRFSGVIATESPSRALRQLRLMYWYGMRDFKLKVGFEGEMELLHLTQRYLHRPISLRKASLRLDVNGGWEPSTAKARLERWSTEEIACVEQPLPRGHEAALISLRKVTDIPIIHDESLISIDDGHRLIELGIADGFNIRISKCGGLLPSLRLAALARRRQVRIQLGCMVGETSILSAAGLRFLEVCPGVGWAEGCFGHRLLTHDVSRRPLTFGFGGRPPSLPTIGLVGDVAEDDLRNYCLDRPVTLNL